MRRTRGVLAVVGVVLSCVLLLATTLGVWARRSFLKTEVFGERAGSLIDQPAVRTTLSAYLGEQINGVIDAESVLADALPDRATILAVPLASAIDEFVQDKVDTFVDSGRFAELWKGAILVTHERAIELLDGDSELVQAEGDRIVINLLPIIDAVLAELGEASPTLFGRTVDLPTITVDDVPDQARAALGDALGVTLDEDFGTFTVYDDGALKSAQDGVALANKLVWLLVVLTPLAYAGTIAISRRRRRTILQLAVGSAVAMVVLRRITLISQDQLLALVQKKPNVPAVEAVADTFLRPLFDGAGWLLVLGLAVAAVALLTGPYAWATNLRRQVVGTARRGAALASDKAQDEETAAWVQRNLDVLRVAGAVVGVALLWWVDLTWARFFVLAILLTAYEVGTAVIAGRAPSDPAPT